MKTGIQQLQLGKILTSEKKARHALEIVKQSGFSCIELDGFMIRKSPFIVKVITDIYGMPVKDSGKFDWLKLVREANLEVISIHEDLERMETKTEEVIQELNDYACHYVTLTGMYQYNYTDEKEVMKLVERLNAVGKKFQEHNITLLYHNHNVEFNHVSKNTKAYDLLIEKTNPDYVSFEFDSYWPSVSGVDAFYYMKKLGKRMKLHHICDNGNRSTKPSLTPIIKNDAVELGYGTLNLDGLIEQDKLNGVECVILEQHKDYIHNDPLESLAISGSYLKTRI